jgi:hypothetical protein
MLKTELNPNYEDDIEKARNLGHRQRLPLLAYYSLMPLFSPHACMVRLN